MAPEYPEDFPPPPNIPPASGDGGGSPAPGPAGPYTVPTFNTGGGGGGNGGGGGGGVPGYQPINIPNAPGFNAPTFNAPTFADAQNEPGYAMRLAAGQRALEQSQAARGMVRTGGSLSDLLELNQNFGSAEYQRVYDRQRQNYEGQYRAAHDAYAPQFAAWNLRAGGEQQAQLARYNAELQRSMPRGGGGGGGGDQEWAILNGILNGGDDEDFY